ncbi:glycoside hydrolase family 5 protein [Burkholderia gladioli]|uniref:glycoside hydrolase family 5 protein n=1 Tax=Burkholderia gladioli TaxID=28095 RepID=UPI0034DB2FFC
MKTPRKSAIGRLRRAAILASAAFAMFAASGADAQAALSMLHASGRQIVDTGGKTVQLKGFNLGGWFVMEGYMSPMDAGSLTDTYSVMKQLDAAYGVTEERALMKAYQDTWIQDQDFANIKAAGFNVVRVPLWWGQFFDLDNPTIPGWRSDAFVELDQLVANAAANGIYVIFDMHGVIGGQGTDVDTGQGNRNAFWSNTEFQSDTAWLWWQIANHFKGNTTVAGYDLINEPTGAPNNNAVWSAYSRFYNSIRSIDPDHMIFIEGTWGNWNWDMLPPPSQYGWTNVVYEMHEYQWGGERQRLGDQERRRQPGARFRQSRFLERAGLCRRVQCLLDRPERLAVLHHGLQQRRAELDAMGLQGRQRHRAELLGLVRPDLLAGAPERVDRFGFRDRAQVAAVVDQRDLREEHGAQYQAFVLRKRGLARFPSRIPARRLRSARDKDPRNRHLSAYFRSI